MFNTTRGIKNVKKNVNYDIIYANINIFKHSQLNKYKNIFDQRIRLYKNNIVDFILNHQIKIYYLILVPIIVKLMLNNLRHLYVIFGSFTHSTIYSNNFINKCILIYKKTGKSSNKSTLFDVSINSLSTKNIIIINRCVIKYTRK
jgi:hypothetical protein